jgi:hypothetical protein
MKKETRNVKATELRIGNWVYNSYTRNEMKVYPMMIQQIASIDKKEHNIKVIELTEEWLLRLGFRKIEGDANFYEIKGLPLCEFTKSGYLMIHFQITGIALPFVHQLQNLYYAHAGEELPESD